jgi:hypothetical protein
MNDDQSTNDWSQKLGRVAVEKVPEEPETPLKEGIIGVRSTSVSKPKTTDPYRQCFKTWI